MNKAMIACQNRGYVIDRDFVGLNKIAKGGATTKKVKEFVCILRLFTHFGDAHKHFDIFMTKLVTKLVI
jgi:hypothetical protein